MFIIYYNISSIQHSYHIHDITHRIFIYLIFFFSFHILWFVSIPKLCEFKWKMKGQLSGALLKITKKKIIIYIYILLDVNSSDNIQCAHDNHSGGWMVFGFFFLENETSANWFSIVGVPDMIRLFKNIKFWTKKKHFQQEQIHYALVCFRISRLIKKFRIIGVQMKVITIDWGKKIWFCFQSFQYRRPFLGFRKAFSTHRVALNVVQSYSILHGPCCSEQQQRK